MLRNALFGRRLQNKMLKGESDIKAGLKAFSLRVRKATDALQTELLAALRGESGSAEEETPLTAELEQRDRVCTVSLPTSSRQRSRGSCLFARNRTQKIIHRRFCTCRPLACCQNLRPTGCSEETSFHVVRVVAEDIVHYAVCSHVIVLKK